MLHIALLVSQEVPAMVDTCYCSMLWLRYILGSQDLGFVVTKGYCIGSSMWRYGFGVT